MKRILFVINRMNFRASSGHGIFMKGVVETILNHGHFIDIVCDGEPEENFLNEYKINIYYPDVQERLSYVKHSTLFQFADSFNFEKSINFRTALTKALSNHVYDLVICNDTESAFVCYQMELYKHMKVTSYAHECASINPELGAGVFKDCYYNLIEQMSYFPITTLIQTEQNKQNLLSLLPYENPHLFVQPYPLTDSVDLQVENKEGILFIGRHEDRKNPGALMKLLTDIKTKYNVELPVKILTRSAHVKKFEADFAEIGHTKYEIKSDVVGEEKARIIQSCKIAFLPYKNESFGIAVLESLRFMPTVVLDKFNWHYNFKEFSNYIVANTKTAHDVVWEAYNNFTVDIAKVDAEFEKYQFQYETQLLTLVNDCIPATKSNIVPRNRLYTKLKELNGAWLSLSNYFKTENSKGVIYLTSDIESIYLNRSWYSIHQTSTDTWLAVADVNGNIQEFNDSVNEENFSFFE